MYVSVHKCAGARVCAVEFRCECVGVWSVCVFEWLPVCVGTCGYLSRRVQVCTECQHVLTACTDTVGVCPAVTTPLHTRMPVMCVFTNTLGWAPSRAKPPPGAGDSQKGNGARAVTTLPLWQVNVEDTVEMLPKSRRALTIQEIAALARSSLHGNCSPRGSSGKGALLRWGVWASWRSPGYRLSGVLGETRGLLMALNRRAWGCHVPWTGGRECWVPGLWALWWGLEVPQGMLTSMHIP